MRRGIVMVVAAAMVLTGGAVLAAGSGYTYTGCLTTGGQIVKVAFGTQPANSGVGQQNQISWN